MTTRPEIHNKPEGKILPIIVLAQFCCTSLWFAGNGVITDLALNYSLPPGALGHLTSAVQFGFIIGTLLFAMLTIADRFSPSKVFFASALIGAIFNLGVLLPANNLLSLILFRFATGFFLAGIYPVGMKIAADYFDKGLGKSLGFLVGALVVGTAFPHLLNDLTGQFSWQSVIVGTTTLAILGGSAMLLLVPDGPYRKPSQKPDFSAFLKVFKLKEFRSAAFGYFGHMWELYAFWAFVPVMLITYLAIHPGKEMNVPLLSFMVIGLGGPACVAGAYISSNSGTKRTAFWALFLSCSCCIISPFVFGVDQAWLFVAFLFFWGMVVIADSPLFSTLVAQNTPAEIKGTALTIVNSIGFAITIISIQLINMLQTKIDPTIIYAILAIGPIFGLIALRKSGPLRQSRQ